MESQPRPISGASANMMRMLLSQVLLRRAVRDLSSRLFLQGNACRSGPATRGQPGRWSGARTPAAGGAERRSRHPLLVRSLAVTQLHTASSCPAPFGAHQVSTGVYHGCKKHNSRGLQGAQHRALQFHLVLVRGALSATLSRKR